MKNLIIINKKLVFLILFLLSCSNYVRKSKDAFLYFGLPDTSYTIPYSSQNIMLLIDAKKGSGKYFYRASQPITNAFEDSLKLKRGKEREEFIESHKIKYNWKMCSDGYMDISKLQLSFLDTSVLNIDSIYYFDKVKDSGKFFIKRNNYGETDLKVVTRDSVFLVHFKIDSSNIIITNNRFVKRWNENAFLWFTWPIHK